MSVRSYAASPFWCTDYDVFAMRAEPAGAPMLLLAIYRTSMGTCWDCGIDDVIVRGNRCRECAHDHAIRIYLLRMFLKHSLDEVPTLFEFTEHFDSD